MIIKAKPMSVLKEEAVRLHKKNRGKISVESKVPVKDEYDLSLAYTPGVAEPCRLIHEKRDLVYEYTGKGNLVAVVTDGTAVLGLGNLGPEAALPVMEGKAVLFKKFAGVDAFPICVGTTDAAQIVEFVKLLAPAFGGVNLEDIAAPACFEVEQRLKAETDIPIFHDDQHGTAVVVTAGLINALKLVGKKPEQITVVINGAGAAAIAVARLLHSLGVPVIKMCDSKGAIYPGRRDGMNKHKEEIALLANRQGSSGALADLLAGADVFIGLSKGGQLNSPMVSTMSSGPIIFALANPEPEIYPEEALAAGAAVVATGRSDFFNQVNNVLAFPGIFRGALDVRASDINEAMKVAAARAIAGTVAEEELCREYIIPKPFDSRVAPAVAEAVARAAHNSGVSRVDMDPVDVAERTRMLLKLQNNV
ncbi:MAG: NAD-dependent malic enzyme [Pelotomaculum sp. PtaB.Bin117]|uniref:NAD(P)-dependent malic enzyme n=1 Tax=Pelotomaculum terephthalicicum TaxID=206393 RepID=UPI0009D0CB21|nr:MAG: NAD-dependent malic enzyme [Pelotomaculum sp. PtaB.Bin117]